MMTDFPVKESGSALPLASTSQAASLIVFDRQCPSRMNGKQWSKAATQAVSCDTHAGCKVQTFCTAIDDTAYVFDSGAITYTAPYASTAQAASFRLL